MASGGILPYRLPPMKTIVAEASRGSLAKQVEDIVLSTPVTDTRAEVERDVKDLSGGAFDRFCQN